MLATNCTERTHIRGGLSEGAIHAPLFLCLGIIVGGGGRGRRRGEDREGREVYIQGRGEGTEGGERRVGSGSGVEVRGARRNGWGKEVGNYRGRGGEGGRRRGEMGVGYGANVESGEKDGEWWVRGGVVVEAEGWGGGVGGRWVARLRRVGGEEPKGGD